MVNCIELLDEKRINFVKFVGDMITEEAIPNRDVIYKKFSELKDIPIERFILWTTHTLKGHAEDLDAYINSILEPNGFTIDKLKEENQIKIKRYLNCFLELVNI